MERFKMQMTIVNLGSADCEAEEKKKSAWGVGKNSRNSNMIRFWSQLICHNMKIWRQSSMI